MRVFRSSDLHRQETFQDGRSRRQDVEAAKTHADRALFADRQRSSQHRFSDNHIIKIVTAIVSLGTVALTSYMKGFDPGATAQKHREAAADIWPIRESYLSLLADIVSGDADLGAFRDRLQDGLAAIYRGAPYTSGDAYADAQVALQKNEEYTFSDDEIDKFLPKLLIVNGKLILRYPMLSEE